MMIGHLLLRDFQSVPCRLVNEIEVNDKVFSNGNKNRWHLGEIVETMEEGGRGGSDERQALVRVQVDDYPDKWVSMRSEQVCNPGTHINNKKAGTCQKLTYIPLI